MEQKTQSRKQLTKIEQDKMISITYTGGANGITSPMGFMPTPGSSATILRSDGKYHDESIEGLAKRGIYPI